MKRASEQREMQTVRVKDKEFVISMPAAMIQQRIAEVGSRISGELEGKNPVFLAILNGSFIFAADLMRCITIPSEISFVKMASYEGTSSTGKMKQLIGLNEDLRGRDIVIVEDIIDSGYTMQELLKMLKAYEPASLRIASLLVKPDNLKVNLKIDYTCFEIPNDFIVGYGLDYDGYGRNLPDIYVIK